MSTPHAVVPARVFMDKRLSGTAKALMGVIAAHETAIRNRWVKLKQQEIADLIGVKRETIHRLAKQLLDMHYLETKSAGTPGRGRTSLEYRILHDLPDNIAEKAEVISMSQREGHNGAEVTFRSPKTDPDVISRSQPYKDSSSVESYPDRPELVSSVADAGASPALKQKPKRRALTQIVDNAEPSLRNRGDAAKVGFVNGSCDALWLRFRDHHLSKGSVMADWDAAWRTWCANEIKFRGAPNGPRTHQANTNSAGLGAANGRGTRSPSSIILELTRSNNVGGGEGAFDFDGVCSEPFRK